MLEPEQPHQMKYEWKTPEMVKPTTKVRSEAETGTNKQTKVRSVGHRLLLLMLL